MRFDELRAALGVGPTEGEAWFHLPGRVIGFGQHSPNTRAIILRSWPSSGPIAVVFARTRVPGEGKYANPAHDHHGSWPSCWLREVAWIVINLPLPVAKSELTDDVRLCSERRPGNDLRGDERTGVTHEPAPDDALTTARAAVDDGPVPLDDLDLDEVDVEDREEDATDGAQGRFAALVTEHENEQLGPLWLAEIRRLCVAASRRYPATAYNDTMAWDAGAIEDLTMDAVERLLIKGQIAYICTVAHDLGSARRLLWRQIKFTLSVRRRPFRTVIDNLLDRAVEQLELSPYERAPGPMTAWRLSGAEETATRTTMDLGPLIVRLRKLPRRPGQGMERASSVWSTEVLQLAIADVIESVDVVDRNLLDGIFRDALTALTLGELNTDAEGSDSAEPSPSPEDEAMVRDTVQRALARLDHEERTIVRLKLDERSDSDVAGALGVSRPTVDKRKREAFEKLRHELVALPDHLDDQMIDMIRTALTGGSG